MKKIFFTTTIYLSLFARVSAAPFPPIFPVSFLTLLGNILSMIPAIVILTFMAMFFWGGYTWMTAQDSEDKVTKAKAILFSALVGLIFVLVARPILEFLQSYFGITNPLI